MYNKKNIISICGSHGVGKTTVIKHFKDRHPNFYYLSESTRILMPGIGYENPYDFVDKYGISFYESIIMGQWALLTQIGDIACDKIILDRSPIDNLAYYYLLRTEEEKKYESVLVNMCKFFCKYIDLYILIPSGVFDLVPDTMQVVETQKKLEEIIKWIFQKYRIKYYQLTQESIDKRCCEIEKIINGKDYDNEIN